MFWADRIAQDILKTKKKHVVDDAKTPSGRVHMGALRGVIIHDLVFRALQDAGANAEYTYFFDDMDPMDDLPGYLSKETYEKYLGAPLKDVPAPEGSDSYAKYFANEFVKVFNSLGAKPKILWTSKFYEEGKLDPYIKRALESAEKIQEIYKKISGSARPKDFYPFQPICENCGKIGTTISKAWDGKEVTYECSETRAAWAKGCKHEGKISPFGGSGKLPFRVEWPAKWAALGVTVEGAGKDHSSKGGTRDTANAISKEIFDFDPPYDIPYEHILLKGRKMSSSKGVGSSAVEIADVLPADVLRFLIVRSRYNQHVDFDPELEHTIPDLFDDWDSLRESTNPDDKRIWQLSCVETEEKNYFSLRFRDLINQVQLPNVDEQSEAEKKKGKLLTGLEKKLLEERAKYVRLYLERFAPEKIKFDVKKTLPKEADNLSGGQKKLLAQIAEEAEKAKDPEIFQNRIYQMGKDLDLSSTDTFKAIYKALIGKEYGPKAAWLILSLNSGFVKKRFEEAASN